jgi:hypothetical protein
MALAPGSTGRHSKTLLPRALPSPAAHPRRE